MNTKEKVIGAQRGLIDALADCETRIASLYERYADCFPAMTAAWLSLANVEKGHAALLKTMHRILDKGSVFYNLGRLNDTAIRPTLVLIDDAMARADDPDLAAADALAVAEQIESSIVDSHFYDVVTSDAPEFKIIAKRLSDDTHKHVLFIRTHFRESSAC